MTRAMDYETRLRMVQAARDSALEKGDAREYYW